MLPCERRFLVTNDEIVELLTFMLLHIQFAENTQPAHSLTQADF